MINPVKRVKEIEEDFNITLIVLAAIIGLAVYLNADKKADSASQTTDTVLMVTPVAFDYNKETAVNNAFQKKDEESNTSKQARKESDAFVKLLRDNGISVITVSRYQNNETWGRQKNIERSYQGENTNENISQILNHDSEQS